MPAAASYICVATPADLATLATAIGHSDLVALDCETTGLNARTDRIRLIAVNCTAADGGHITYLVDAFKIDPSPLWESLAAAHIVCHNAIFDLAFIGRLGFVPGRVHDTRLLSQVLYASSFTKGHAPIRHGLKDCCERELGIILAKDLQKSNWSGPLTSEQLEYAALDASVLVPLHCKLMDELQAANLTATAEIESAALPCITWMAGAGVQFDSDTWSSIARGARAEAERLALQLDAAAPDKPGELFDGSWNWDSPEQVKQALGLAGCPVDGTRDDVLAALEHPLARLIRDYREASKRASTYGEAWLKHVADDGRIYPSWAQFGANSGRMACGSPNMQNLPRGAYRRCVIAPPGCALVKADYSQIELRIAAKISNDRALLAAYQRGDDLHILTARHVLGVPEVTSEARQLAKAINFGLLYGMGAKAFRSYARTNYGVDMTEEQAAQYREAFFRTYPGLRQWHRSIKDGACETRTLTGRRVRNVERFTEKLNLPVQGTGADGLKAALALLWERRRQCGTAVPVLAVHDEVVVQCPVDDAPAVANWLKSAMIDAMAPLIEPIPVDVEVKTGRTWGGD
jgi:DNA polymerase I